MRSDLAGGGRGEGGGRRRSFIGEEARCVIIKRAWRVTFDWEEKSLFIAKQTKEAAEHHGSGSRLRLETTTWVLSKTHEAKCAESTLVKDTIIGRTPRD